MTTIHRRVIRLGLALGLALSVVAVIPREPDRADAATTELPVLGHFRNIPGLDWWAEMHLAEATYGEFAGHWRSYHPPGSNPLDPDEPIGRYEVAAAAEGKLLHISWRPWLPTGNFVDSYDDATIDTVMTRLRDQCGPDCWLSVAHEANILVMNGGPGFEAEAFRALWARIAASRERVGADNVKLVWIMQGAKPDLHNALWPGNDLVDVIGHDPYVRGDEEPAELLGTKILERTKWFADNSTPEHDYASKPVVIAEFGCDRGDPHGDRWSDLHRAQCIDGVRAILDDLPSTGMRIIEMEYFEARNNPLSDPPTIDGNAFLRLKQATEGVPLAVDGSGGGPAESAEYSELQYSPDSDTLWAVKHGYVGGSTPDYRIVSMGPYGTQEYDLVADGDAIAELQIVSDREGWARTYLHGGRLLRWNGKGWAVDTSLPVSGSHDVLHVWATRPHDAWVLTGEWQSDTNRDPHLWHWNGFGWKEWPLPATADSATSYNSLLSVSPREVWLAGADAAFVGTVWRWTGRQWIVVDSAPGRKNPSQLAGASGNVWYTAHLAPDLFDFGYHWDGAQITEHAIPTPDKAVEITRIDPTLTNSGTAWMVGQVGGLPLIPQVLATSSDEWALQNSPPATLCADPSAGVLITDIEAISDGDVYAAGACVLPNEDRVPLLTHFDGGSWTLQ